MKNVLVGMAVINMDWTPICEVNNDVLNVHDTTFLFL